MLSSSWRLRSAISAATSSPSSGSIRLPLQYRGADHEATAATRRTAGQRPPCQERRNLRPAPGLTDLQLISTPSAIALHIRLARCDHGRSSSGGGKGDDRGGTSQRSVNAERSTNCSVLVTLPSLPALAAPALPFPGYEVGIPCAAMC